MKTNGAERSSYSSSSSSLSSTSPLSTLDYLSQSSSRFRLAAAMDPDSFAASFDLLHELSNNRDEYNSDEVQLTCYHFPSYLLMLVDQTKEQVPKGIHLSRPSRNAVITCCLSHGMGVLSKNEHISELFRLKRRMNVLTAGGNGHNEDAVLAKSIWDVFQKWSVASRDSSDDSRQGLYLSKNLKQAVFGIKTDLSLSLDSLVSICLQISLHDQDWVMGEIRRDMDSNIQQFFRAARIRRQIFEILLGELEKVEDGQLLSNTLS